MDISEKYGKVLSQSLLFRDLTAEETEEIISGAFHGVVSLKKNEMLTLPEELNDIYLVLSGQFNVIINDSGMDQGLVHILTPGQCFGIAFCTEHIVCCNILQAAEKGELIRLSYEEMLGQEQTRVRLLKNMLAITSVHLQMLADKISHTQSRSVRVKLSAFLRDQMAGKGKNSFTVDMSRKDMAEYLNITYPAMTRELSQMQKEGILKLEGSRITILDAGTLTDQGDGIGISR